MVECKVVKSQPALTGGQSLTLVVISLMLVSALPTVAGNPLTPVPDGLRAEATSRNALVIEYHVREDQILITLRKSERGDLTDGGIRRVVRVPCNRTKISSQVRLFRQQIVRRDPRFVRLGRVLFNTLIAPILEDLAEERVLVVRPDDSLAALPFQALVSPVGQYLIETQVVLYLPDLDRHSSAGNSAGEEWASPENRLLALGNPVPAGRVVADQSVTERLNAPPPLPEAELEARVIAGMHGHQASDLVIGRSATEKAFRELAPHRRYIHLATHAESNARDPLRSHFLLTPVGTDPEEDGRLEVWEIRLLQFRAEVAILSACETARVAKAPNDRITGLGLAFLEAGCQSVIVNQWEIDSRRTAESVVLFFETMRKIGGTGPTRMATALRLTTLRSIKNAATHHPYYWAGMSVIGR